MTTTGPVLHSTPTEDSRRRGVQDLLHPRVVGVLVGASGATGLVHANRGGLADPWPVLALVAWVLAVGACGWATLVRRRALGPAPRPGRAAGAVYGASVVAMVAAFAGGAALLRALGHPDWMPAVVVLVIGLHFVPFAAAFAAPVFAVLGWTLAGLGAVGLVLCAVAGPAAAPATAVVGGLVMLAVMTVDALRDAAPTPGPAPDAA